MAKVRVTFANGVAYVYDTELHSHPTHYGDEHGVQHAVVSSEPAADDEECRFETPDGTHHPLASNKAAPAEDKDAKIARLEAELAAAGG